VCIIVPQTQAGIPRCRNSTAVFRRADLHLEILGYENPDFAVGIDMCDYSAVSGVCTGPR
jgi:hypothetical protein